MTDPRLATSTDFGRMYAREVGGELLVPSITTVIGQQASDLSGWHGYMAAKAVLEDSRASRPMHSNGMKFAIIRDAASASERYRDQAAARGDRVHNYAENIALRAMGKDHELERTREELLQHGEQAYADRLDEWWDAWRPRPLAAEVTVWNETVGYAGTLDLVAEIAGRVCIIDYKTKGTDKRGRVKPLDNKVVMQLVAGVKAEEALVDAEAGQWQPWQYGSAPILMGVAVGETQVLPQQANPNVLKENWRKFCALRRVWEINRLLDEETGDHLMPVVPPPAHLLATPPAVDPAQVVEPVSVQEVEGAPSLEELALDASSETATALSSIEEPTAERGN
ncbi:cytochrome [Rothia terrae]|uniref:PD-(D/E)XK nuclease family protein n=1 Tax=Rothia terrae TaxID=396015 RepID=A0A7H2BBI8_9MICC|nr:PD-(D/E)XK nuclease family protein [Rothia terrae]NKZ35212.1 cytochrome [Rothia terrae]QNV37034.1 PD-(D/E)XK nuclease family protein [Rothia terrae]